jgi:hypothetical protein
MFRRWRTALVLPFVLPFVLMLALASCAGNGEGSPREEQPPSIVVDSFPAEQSAGPTPQGVTTAVIDHTVRPAHLTVTAWGTPGCMRYPVAVTWRDQWTVQVSTAASDNHACSTEYLPVSQVVVLPAEQSAHDVRAVEVDGRPVAFAFEGEQ